jgi:hypothetical protein
MQTSKFVNLNFTLNVIPNLKLNFEHFNDRNIKLKFWSQPWVRDTITVFSHNKLILATYLTSGDKT